MELPRPVQQTSLAHPDDGDSSVAHVFIKEQDVRTGHDFSGLWIPLVTPFKDGQVDHAALTLLVRRLANAGVAGLVASINPALTATQIRAILEDSVIDLGSAGLDPQFGHGRISAYLAAVAANASLCRVDFNNDGTADFFDYLDFVAAFAASNSSADFNADSVVDLFDYLDFVSAFAAGC